MAALIWFLASLIPLGIGGLGILEGYLYLSGRAPVTSYVRHWRDGHAWSALGLGFLLVALVAAGIVHFLLDG